MDPTQVTSLSLAVAALIATVISLAYQLRRRSDASLSRSETVARGISALVYGAFVVVALQQEQDPALSWIFAAALIIGALGTGWPLLAAAPRVLRRLGGRQSSARPRTSDVRATVLVVVIFVVALSLVAVAIRLGLRQLGGADSSRSISSMLSQLLIFTSGSGALAFAVVEFVKRQSPLRRLYNRRIVDRYFHPSLESVRAEILNGWRESPVEVRARRSVVPITPISYSADVQQLTAQVGHAARTLLRASAGTTLPGPVVARLFESAFGDRHLRHLVDDRPDDDRSWTALDEALESRLDAFQVEATTGWHSLLRGVAGVSAATFACMLAWAADGGVLAVSLAAGLGLVVGGPVSWIIRDVVRVIERKAAY